MSEQFDEPLDACIPEAFVVTEPVVGARERPRVDAAVMDASANGALHKAGPLEGLDVLRRREAVRGELTGGLFAPGEALEHRPPGVVAEGAEDEVESMCTFNHIVEYGHGTMIVNPVVERMAGPPDMLALAARLEALGGRRATPGAAAKE